MLWRQFTIKVIDFMVYFFLDKKNTDFNIRHYVNKNGLLVQKKKKKKKKKKRKIKQMNPDKLKKKKVGFKLDKLSE